MQKSPPGKAGHIGCCFLSAVGLVYIAYHFRINQIKHKEKLRSDHEIKINNLENDAFHNQLNPHFIFNSLNTINSFINKNETATSNQYITKFSKLLRLILEHSRQRKITLADELNVVDLYLQVERIRFENKFNYQINIDPDIDADVTEISPLIIQPFVENAILHGLLPLLSEGLLQINLQRKNNTLVCIIEDNGIGRSQSICNKQFSPKKSKSYGIGTTLKRIELFNKDYNINSPVIITDLVDSNNNASGTKVEIILAWVQSF
ncbi:MAG: histidine kinase [Chitinophagaceae bacterium]|nr:histidine kinase [Chitinophagaceae bacterium]